MDELQKLSTIKQISIKLFNPYRLIILMDLKLNGERRLNKIKDDVELSYGNLSGHLKSLEKKGFIKSNTFLDKKSLVRNISITEKGLKVLDEFREQLKNIENILSTTNN